MVIKDIKLMKTSFSAEDLIRDQKGKVLFMGRSNVGKSSLINKLANRKNLARTSSRPGKTVSINYYLVNQAFYFIDLPGYGFAKISKSENRRVQSLISVFFDRIENVRLALILIDARRGFMEADIRVLEKIINKNFKVLTILTKSDKIGRSQLESQIKNLHETFGLKVIPFSIKSNNAKVDLLRYIYEAVDSNASSS